MNKFLILKTFILNIGTVLGLFFSEADDIFWITEIPIIFLFTFFFKEKLHDNIEKIAFNLSLRVFFYFSLTLCNSLIFIHFIEFWKELIGLIIGCLIASWIDIYEKFKVNNAIISWQSKIIIFIKMVGIMMMNNFSMINLNGNYYLFCSTLVISFMLGILMIGNIYSNIQTVLGIQFNNILYYRLLFWVEICVMIILQLMCFGHQIQNKTGNFGWSIGMNLTLFTNFLFYLLGYYESKKKEIIHSTFTRLTEITIIIQPDLDIKIGEKISKNE